MVSFRNKGVKIVVGILVVGILTAFLLPTAISPIAEDRTQTITQSEDNQTEVTGVLASNATRINATTGEIDVTLKNTDNGDNVTITALSEGANKTVTLSGSEITVNNTKVKDTNTANVKYTYPEEFGWGNGSQALYGLLPIFFVLAILLFVVKKAT